MRHFGDLLTHLRATGNVLSYLRLLIGRHRQFMAYVLIVFAAVTGVALIQDHSIDREHKAQLVACERVQVLRDQTNGITLLAYDTWMNAYVREKILGERDSKDAAEHKKSAAKLLALARTMVVTGPTDCDQAVDNPDHYKSPAPEFVYKGGPHIKIVRARSHTIVEKAKTGQPLYGDR